MEFLLPLVAALGIGVGYWVGWRDGQYAARQDYWICDCQPTDQQSEKGEG